MVETKVHRGGMVYREDVDVVHRSTLHTRLHLIATSSCTLDRSMSVEPHVKRLAKVFCHVFGFSFSCPEVTRGTIQLV
jgi:hypothetical protein